MSARITVITTGRVLSQLLNDRRTVALILIVPSALIILIRYIFDDSPAIFNHVGLILLGAFPFMLMFLISSIALLRERVSGTLERILTTPTGKADLVAAYTKAFGLAAAVQTSIAVTIAYWWLGITVAGPTWGVFLVCILSALLGMSLGLFVSAFATTEFQAMQFMPVFVVPQLFLGGLIWPAEKMAPLLQHISDALPFTYTVKALDFLQNNATVDTEFWRYVAVLAGSVLIAVIIAIATLKRRTS